MGFVAKDSGGGNFTPVPPGAYVARCYQVIDLGTQTTTFQGDTKVAHKLRLSWEIFGEDDAGLPLTVSFGGKTMPMTIAKSYTVSLHEKASLCKDLSAWRGREFTPEEKKAFDVSKLLGAYALINVTNGPAANGKIYANVAGLSPLPKALAANKPAGIHELVRFDLDNPDMAVFEELPPFIQEQIRSAPEWDRAANRQLETADAGGSDDDIPF
jgi:hypothetical protein